MTNQERSPLVPLVILRLRLISISPLEPHKQTVVTLTLQKRELRGNQSNAAAADASRSGVTDLLCIPCGCRHDASSLFYACLRAAAVRVMAEAQAVSYLVSHGGCSADGEFRVVLESRPSLRTTHPAQTPHLLGPQRSLLCSHLQSSLHGTYPPQAPGPPWCPGRCDP